jgi:hypothetical protein
MVRFFWRIAFFALATSVFSGERLTALVTAAQDFSVVIHERDGTQHGLLPENLYGLVSKLSYGVLKSRHVPFACSSFIPQSWAICPEIAKTERSIASAGFFVSDPSVDLRVAPEPAGGRSRGNRSIIAQADRLEIVLMEVMSPAAT